MPNGFFYVRNVAYSIIIALSLAVLGLSGYFTALTAGDGLPVLNWEGLGMASGFLTALCLITFLIVGSTRKNATITSVGVELPTLVVLSALFLAEGVVMQDPSNEFFRAGCSQYIYFFDEPEAAIQVCRQFTALQKLSFANFGIMIAFWFTLLVIVIVAAMQGQNVFGQSIGEITFFTSNQTQAQADGNTGGYTGDTALKQPTQQQQIQSQQMQPQYLQQQAMFQPQYMQQHREQV